MAVKITAVLPCHNHAKWVADAIQSILNQTHPVDNIVIINNGSWDGSRQKITDLFGVMTFDRISYENITLETHIGKIENIPTFLLHTDVPLGPAKARNLGIRYLWDQTDIFALLDTDDEYAPRKIELSLPYFEDDNVGMVYSDYETENVDSGLRVREWKEPYCRDRLLTECLANSDSLIAKKVFEKVGFFQEDMRVVEDWSMWVRISEAFLLVHVPLCLVKLRTGSHSSTAQISRETWEENWRKMAQGIQQRSGIR